MKLGKIAMAPLHVAAVATGSASFRYNPVIGSPALNRRGLHRARVKIAERMAESRRRRLAHLLSPEHREMFEELGYVKVENALPEDAFAKLDKELRETRFLAREMKQGATVTRFITVPPGRLKTLPGLSAYVRGSLFQGLMRYAAATNSDPLFTLHTVLTDPDAGAPDPQTTYHMDTFHATSKSWLFVRDVEEEDGPFSYVPGSHRVTPARLEWEYEQSLHAAAHRDSHHALGSFRASEDDVAAMGYERWTSFPVKANTMIVADTHGFHARRPPQRKSTRLAIYGSLRTNPFTPFTGLDLFRLPGLRGRRAQVGDLMRKIEERIKGKPEHQPIVGEVLADAPAVR